MSLFIMGRCLCSGTVSLRRYSNRYTKALKVPKSIKEDKMARVMQKMLDKQKKKAGKPVSSDFIRLPGQTYEEPNYPTDNPKYASLNKLYMMYVTEAMGSGELGSLNMSVAFDITKVQISPTYQYLYVSWTPSDDNLDDVAAVQDHLNSIAPLLRHVLSSQRSMGLVPIVRFAQDKSQFRILQLEKALRTADKGPDWTADSNESITIPQFLLPTEENPQDKFGDRPLEMRQDVLDLDHAHLMKQVMSRPRKKLDEVRTPNPVGDYDTETAKEFNLLARKLKYQKKGVRATETVEREKIRVELINEDIVEEDFEEEEESWDYEKEKK